ncbi:PREDICTED: E3 ubiquitin-protein ligase RFWD3 [Populus euphratica]|uniref:RING-type E3 ubiquitin transferase n=1 Tax=Populus euphratica TaxID=75702 RepID=A0AAJ6TXC5_POPEU|nr:PREDICTED: E3 ubiquitin-protein ligase RFWD3 [Populus euphratica]XP_011018782.1 PREDICTED: E3 ubiquitin-protein ligase RFWD3 [Populus euphratica]XP_011018783.1 PREDICTED: E3 ubiquitin-protein ligase RFWD3 [Populus euphratica]
MAEPYITDERDYEAMQLLEIGLELSESEYSEEDEDFIPVVELDSSPRFLLNSDQATTTAAATAENLNFQEEEVDVDEERNKRRRVDKLGSGGDICCRNGGDDADGESSQNSQWNRSEFDGLFCPICMEAWTNEGDHHICCLPCGHLFGLSCIEKWLRQRGRLAKCPQCNRKGTLRDIRKLFVPRIAVVDEESQKRIRFLEEKCASLVKKGVDLCKKESEWKRREAALQLEVQKCKERTIYLEHLLGDLQSRPSGLATAYRGSQGHEFGNSIYSDVYRQGSSSCFMLQRELRVDGARLFDVDASGKILLLVRRVPKMGGSHVLTKMSLIPPHESEDIFLPPGTKIIKDLHISPTNGSLALFASLGKKLSVLSMESNNVILSYDLPAAAWSCSWDRNCSHYVYAGLQNGSLLVFDMRVTGSPVESRLGHTTDPIHTVQSLQHISTLPSGLKTVVSASSVGMCQWNFGGEEERPFLIPQTTNQGVCISLAYCASSDDIVVSYRPRVEMSNEVFSQTLLKPSPVTGQGVLGSHLHLKRVGSNYEKLGIACSTVSGIRLPKSSIIDRPNQKPLFVTGDEVSCGLILQELPSFTATQRLKSHQHCIYDVKYTSTHSQGLLGCLSEDTVQLFSTKLS